MPVRVDFDSIVAFVREQGPVTDTEIRFAFTYPDDVFAHRALQLVRELTGRVTDLEGLWWTAVVEEEDG